MHGPLCKAKDKFIIFIPGDDDRNHDIIYNYLKRRIGIKEDNYNRPDNSTILRHALF